VPAARATAAPPAAERRRLTVVFCDLVGATALATALAPEAMPQQRMAHEGG
jgi:class 3 adenylate cyclase